MNNDPTPNEIINEIDKSNMPLNVRRILVSLVTRTTDGSHVVINRQTLKRLIDGLENE